VCAGQWIGSAKARLWTIPNALPRLLVGHTTVEAITAALSEGLRRRRQAENVFVVNGGIRFKAVLMLQTMLNQEGMLFDSLADPRRVQSFSGRISSLTLLVHFFSLVRLQFSPDIIRCRCQLDGEIKEVIRLAGEEQVGCPGINRGDCTSQLGGGRANH
jgi:hypothetical protein